eukprot:TRINITY_DN6508_c0_g1_i1.p1 TRINITY_DN6508_c0_g1~~TRINITY_DN6508_c0_g1_i1.p1  ORF type:complete len:327 (-),score=65.09 TRINITY_DN6508_c0_g1_i1:128-1108(-)
MPTEKPTNSKGMGGNPGNGTDKKPPAPRDYKKRGITAALAIMATMGFLSTRESFCFLPAILAFEGQREWDAITKRIVERAQGKLATEVDVAKRSWEPLFLVRCLMAAVLCFSGYFGPRAFLCVHVTVMLGRCFAAIYANRNVASRPASHIDDLTVTVLLLVLEIFGFVWANGLAFSVLLHRTRVGTIGLFLILACNWATDAVSLVVGRKHGKTSLCPLSPKKTVEGSAAGILASLVAGLLAYLLSVVIAKPSPRFDLWWFLAMSLFIAVVGIVGDLLESLFKRVALVKDSGTFFPAHGGVLDRVDGLLVLFPIVYVLLMVLYPSEM